MLHGHQTNHQLFIKFPKLILKAVNFYKIKQNPYHLPIKFEHFPILLYRALLFEEIKYFLKWPQLSIPLNKSPTFFLAFIIYKDMYVCTLSQDTTFVLIKLHYTPKHTCDQLTGVLFEQIIKHTCCAPA